eukprot:CAMPEP_0167780794 /NCGR_PEP_ID=MMETSP0111_2-20121227/5562_1 /TAXON_ID=91324 /ORGANISM="Lotharella globosa, Strain CCCM811" /LENGTH=111 /DNA_ID=CAMNT_0007671359 /DNA_START=667 /DNA_END=998 /DNA_ORIENTATION=+
MMDEFSKIGIQKSSYVVNAQRIPFLSASRADACIVTSAAVELVNHLLDRVLDEEPVHEAAALFGLCGARAPPPAGAVQVKTGIDEHYVCRLGEIQALPSTLQLQQQYSHAP